MSVHSGGKEMLSSTEASRGDNDEGEKIIEPEEWIPKDDHLHHSSHTLHPPAPTGDSSSKDSGSPSNFDLLENEEEERLLGDAGPLPPFDGVTKSPQSINTRASAGKSSTAPSLRSVSLPKGPVVLPAVGGATSPELGRAHSVTEMNGAPCSQTHLATDKKPKKVVSEYYKKQNELLESFKSDNEQIQVFQKTRTRQRLQSQNSNDGKEVIAEELVPVVAVAPIVQQTHEEDVSVVTAPSTKKKASTLVGIDFDDHNFEDTELLERHAEAANASKAASKAASRLATITLAVNVILMIAKAFAAYLSSSLSIISSLVDSMVDITSGTLIFMTSRAIRKRDPYTYPRGNTRLEPISLICISVIMGFASLQLLIESIKKIISQDVQVDMSYSSAGIMIATIMVKGTLVLICKKYPNDASIRVLAQDHRNDCVSNFIALMCAAFTPVGDTGLTFFNTPGWKYLDPIGAILVSMYIMKSWYYTGKEHVVMLAGKSANNDFINRIIKVCIDHDPRIEHIDTVYVYHYGMKFLVEVHIVLDENMPLKVAHDISESLQINIESLEDVERAFVHTDYEYNHQPADEHKVV